MEKLTKEQAAVIGAYTGTPFGPIADIQEYIERILGRTVRMHELPALEMRIREVAKPDFLALCRDK